MQKKKSYKDIVEPIIKGEYVRINKSENSLKERIQVYLDQYPKYKLSHYVQQHITYLAKDIFKNIKETSRYNSNVSIHSKSF